MSPSPAAVKGEVSFSRTNGQASALLHLVDYLDHERRNRRELHIQLGGSRLQRLPGSRGGVEVFAQLLIGRVLRWHGRVLEDTIGECCGKS